MKVKYHSAKAFPYIGDSYTDNGIHVTE